MRDTRDVHPWLRVTRDRAVQHVTLARPEQRNPHTPSLWLALAQVAGSVPSDVRVVVLRGEGESFSAGLHRGMLVPGGMPDEPDLLDLAASGGSALEEAIVDFQRGFTAWASISAIVVAAVQGNAIGAGLQLALAADLRLLADDARLAMRETSLGLVPDLGGTSSLVHLVGYARALEICATGRAVGASEAVAIGLATAQVPADQLDAATDDLVGALLAAPERALRELKPLLRHAVSATSAEQALAERQAQARLLTAMVGGG